MKLRIPPGRAGRLWLRERLASARKAADLLDHKRRELEVELERVGSIAARREGAWRTAAHDAREWLGRVDATDGQRGLGLASILTKGPAEIQLRWQQVMGVRYPADYTLQMPVEPCVSPLEGGAALTPAIAAHRRALDAGVAYAIAAAAVGRIRADVARTTRRLRALRLRAIPAHESALATLELTLDEKDREDAVSARWAADSSAPTSDVGETR